MTSDDGEGGGGGAAAATDSSVGGSLIGPPVQKIGALKEQDGGGTTATSDSQETSRRLEIAGSSSTAEVACGEAVAPMTSMPGADSALVRYSGLGRGLQLGTVPIEMLKLNGADAPMTSMPVADSVKEIWAENVEEAFQEIESTVRRTGGTLFVGLDTEFCRKDGVSDPIGAPTSEDAHYLQACRIVNEGDLLQVGIAFANQGFQLVAQMIFQFNLFFDQSTRSSESKNLRFIKDIAQLRLDDHRNRGIPLPHFFSLMNVSGLVGNQNLVWVTYQGYSDFGYLIRGIQKVSGLPQRRIEFMDTVRSYFPKSCDIKILHDLGICCKPPPPLPRPKGTGGLQAMANGLRVDRIGEAHGAGSDAYLTLTCYKTMVLSSPTAAVLISRFRNTMYGVAEASTLAWDDRDATEIEVCGSNFGREARMFSQLFCNRSRLLVSVDIRFASGGDFNGNAISYAMLRAEAALSGPVEISFAVTDMGGCLLFGRLWTFRVGSGQDRIEPAQFAKMLTEDEVILNPNVLWCSSSSTTFAYLVKVLSSSNCLPLQLQAFFALSAAFFPNLRVLSVMLPEKRPTRRALMTLRHFQALLRQEPREGWLPFFDLTK